ncbi:MAG: 23S rRNA (pseudouridine(1915)-N(3))-methyltransferase RlmH [Saprospiraceae bacterium]
MKISIWVIGKTDEKYLTEGIQKYLDRLKHYTKLNYEEFKDVKPSYQTDDTIKREAEMILSKLIPDDILIVLDEKGEEFSSTTFAEYLQKLQNRGPKHVIFLVGGAYGHHSLIRQRANHLISLSKMTFSHQMVRLFLAEQLYRAFTIIKNEKYHNL